MSELDKAFHLVASATENIHWHDFREVGALAETECDYYYAENERPDEWEQIGLEG